ncbi:Tricetin 3',4',5'-O-trimethyltransferase [Platanthera zijinensis]|uniref:Tricetin 3',4',5'-O-trimethyltransferase n=1 Tax=Platanthera zijinensis TaxID=2320716 RepID=A0AAP0G9F5_9ASPA
MDQMLLTTKSPNDSVEDAYAYAMQLASLSVLPMTLRAALELGLLRLISDADGPLSSDELAARLGLLPTNPRAAAMIERILRLLASYSILSCGSSSGPNGEGRACIPRYGPTLVCNYFSPDKNNASLDALALVLQDKIIMENWYHVKDAVINGGTPFDLAHGMKAFEYKGKDSEFNAYFNEGMSGHSSIIMKKVLDAYQGFHDIDVRVVVDVGGGLGSTLNMIIARHNHIKGINFDLPQVVSHAPPIPNVQHIGGDMFDTIPSGDIIFLKWILHGWSDEHCVKILKNCRKALPSGGKVVIVEYILPKSPEHNPEAQVVFHTDMIMLLQASGGIERTEKEFEVLALQSGFTAFKPVYINSNACVMELSNE